MKLLRSGLVWISLAAGLALCFFMWEVSRGFRTVLASSIATVSSVFGQTGIVNIPVTTTDIATPGSPPAAGKTIWYTKAGLFCSLSPSNSENCTGSTAGLFYQTVETAGTPLTQQPALNFVSGMSCVNNGGSSRTDCTPTGGTANQNIRSVGGSFDGGGSALTSGKTTYVTMPIACTLAGYNILADTGTASFDIWKVATGTAIPTVANTIISGTSYLALVTGTALHSTSTSSLTTTAVAANDIFGIHLQAVSGATFTQVTLQCNAT